ncbi:MAG: ADP-ribosylglycohydrolase family protein [Lachnospiraceae bacterium]|nr:ADP-ribosylglycohydrolase family protein [Lachnospiraceae bacterium]
MMNNKNMMLNGMMGLVVGDALGCPVQFLSRNEIKKRKRGPVTGMEGFGTFNMPPGTWTDDSSMSFAELASIKEKGGIDLDDMMKKFVQWNFDGAFTPFGQAFDQGMTCLQAIWNFCARKDVTSCGKRGEYANGNGALMRILPVCIHLVMQQTPTEEAVDQVRKVTALTHNHLRSHIASGLHFFMVKSIMNREANDSFMDCLQRGLDEGFAFFKKDVENHKELALFERRLASLEAFAKVPEEEIKSTGYVLDTIEAAIWCLITTEDIKTALLKAVNLGDDTDTVAAIAGGLAGLFFGMDEIPAEWIKEIQKVDWIIDFCKE